MQAGAMGLPSIVSNINGCNEIIIEAKNGTIIPTKNTEALYVKMKSFYLGIDTNYDAKICRKLIEERYSQNYIWDKILKEYNSLP